MTEQNHGEFASSRPLSVHQIVEKAQSFDYNPLIPLKYWLRTANTLLKEAAIYEREGNEQQTYLLLFRHAQLVLGNLQSHPDARHGQNQSNLLQAKHEVKNNLAKLEILKPRVNKRYQRHEQLLQDRDIRKTSSTTTGKPHQYIPESPTIHGSRRSLSSDPAMNSGTETLAAGENKDLAVELAHREIRRRATVRNASRQAKIPEKEEHKRLTAGLGGSWEDSSTKNGQDTDRDTLSQQMQNVRLQVNGKSGGHIQNESSPSSFADQRFSYQYPRVPGQSLHEPRVSSVRTSKERSYNDLQAPELPPKEKGVPANKTTEFSQTHQDASSRIEIQQRSNAASPPQYDLKPSTFIFKPSAYLENGSPLRTIFLPPNLRLRFLELALPNTQANLETCGILCGTLISNALFISKLVIPDQESTSDTCETVNEDKLFEFVDGEDLMVLGWIHTHPTQTCFMSSRDLHTHSGYQAMMPESIAIVCAPSKGDWGVFRLTDPPGMKSILSCTQKGLFHPHVETEIYTNALRPGHVHEAKGLEFDVVDLRPVRGHFDS